MNSANSRNQPRVTVCVPTYNSDAHVRECLSSILAQTYGDYELLVVDNCSTDATEQIVMQVAGGDRRLRYSRNPSNLGMVPNWNRCVELATGEWLKFVFSDDVIMPNCLERLLAFAGTGVPIVACHREIFWGDAAPADVTLMQIYARHQQFIQTLYPLTAFVFPSTFSRLTLNNPGVNLIGEPTCVLLHRSAFSRYGMFDVDLVQMCDLEFWARVATSAGVIVVSESLARFRSHRNSETSRNRTDVARMEYLDRLIVTRKLLEAPVFEQFRVACTRDELAQLAGHAAVLKAQISAFLGQMRAPPPWSEVAAKYLS